MASLSHVDAVLLQWGDRLFYPANRQVRGGETPRLSGPQARRQANAMRRRIEATVRRAPQVMVKVTGGGRNMKTISAHWRYISKHGRLDIEDERGEVMSGRACLKELADEWRLSGSAIDEGPQAGQRREALNIMLSMPRGTDPDAIQKAARAFAQTELAGHKYVMVLHDHQANPHVHLSARVESHSGRRLNPRKTDLHRWRETFAEKLRGYGIEAEATRQATRGRRRHHDEIWQVHARADGRLIKGRADVKTGSAAQRNRAAARHSWMVLGQALVASGDPDDLRLAGEIAKFLTTGMGDGRASARDPKPGRQGPLQKETLAPKPRNPER